MKRVWMMLLSLMLVCGMAAAQADEAAVDQAAVQAMLAERTGYEVMACDQWGDTAAAVLARGEERVLCIAERKDGVWQLVVDNDAALPQGADIRILMDTDEALYWSYDDVAGMYHYSLCSFRIGGVWGVPACIRSEMLTGGMESYTEVEHRLKDGLLRFEVSRWNENEKRLGTYSVGPFPAKWAEKYDTLAAYDHGSFPNSAQARDGSWLNQAALERCALEIMPEYTLIDGAATDAGLELFMKADDGTLRMVTWSAIGEGPATNISSLLPEGTQYNDMHAYIAMPDGKSASLGAYNDGVWHVKSIFTGNGTTLVLGRSWVAESVWYGSSIYVGDHPWVTLDVDWDSLPMTLDEALDALDAGRWAVVNNPNPADRLHLREKADRSARSYGKYYNGTPVEVLKRDGDWTRVRTPSGNTGWMMTEYLAFGKDAWEVANAFPQLRLVDPAETFPVWKTENVTHGEPLDPKGDWTVRQNEPVYIIGVVDEEWYHVWFPQLDAGGCMRQSDFWAGNG